VQPKLNSFVALAVELFLKGFTHLKYCIDLSKKTILVVACIEKPSCSHVFIPFLVNSTETRLTRFPASRLDRTNAFDVFEILSSCIRKGSVAWKSNAPRVIRSVPSSNLLQICNTESSCNRSKYEKEDDEFVKTKLNSRGNGAMIRKGER